MSSSANTQVLDIRHDSAAGRFQAEVQGQRCVADYRLLPGQADTGTTMVFHHTGVPATLAGQGIAAKLVSHALTHARNHGWRVQPACSYVRAYMRRHPETHDLLN